MSDYVPRQVSPDDACIPEILELIRRCFAYMEPRIDPPSSMHRLTVEAIAEKCETGEVWVAGDPIVSCVFMTILPGALYIGKLAVDETIRGQGLARQLVDLSNERAKQLGLRYLELETRIELTDNHKTFKRLGFEETGKGAHEGYDHPTYIVMRKPVI